ncbi:cache domain-containing sensor histidine kinase [Paenibacillus tyrfis]|uniref:cache domain-containing sensor histidine kinase n=1 Tax=Paenibacillus tyrfis TaxID=1501230 RepID=UPI00209D82DF|nr:sensor histidine kinase [Paenibacillus tyrfis]MCP1308681.1 sensor histidine kinase [Paenibacillus tyrfis]
MKSLRTLPIPPFSHWSLRSKTLLIFMLLIAIPLSLQGGITYYDFSTSVERRTADYSAQLVGQINRNLDRTFMEMQRLSLMPTYDPGVLGILRKYRDPALATNQRPTVEELEKMLLYIAGMTYNRPDIRGIQLFAGSGYTFSNVDASAIRSFTDVKREAWYERVKQADGAWVAIPKHRPSYYFDDSGQDYVSVARLIREPNTNEGLGVVKIDLKEDVFRQIVSNVKFEEKGGLLVVNSRSELFFQQGSGGLTPEMMDELRHTTALPQASDVRHMDIRGKTYLAIVDYSDYSDLKVISYIPVESLLKETKDLRNFTFGIGLFCLVSAGALATFFSYRLSRPLAALKNKMLRVEQGSFKQSVRVESKDEIGQLSRGFNRMVEEIDRLVHEVFVIGLREKEAELAVLQSQINPHFIYNTLESINMLALKRQNDDVSDMVSALGRLLRYTVGRNERLVRLREELESAASYVKIQQLRYGERLKVMFDVEEGLFGHEVPKLLFQPLVENAIYHGIGDREEGGTIWIEVVRFEEELLLTVRDDGKGMSEDELRQLRQSLAAPPLSAAEAAGEHGLALNNINQRLMLMYGERYGLHVDGSPGEGTAFTITIPIREEGEHDD